MKDINNFYFSFPNVTPDEISLLQRVATELSENQLRNFQMIYAGRRQNSQNILLFTLLGFLGIAGIQRFILGQNGMGIAYLLTGGCFGIGTIIDLINNKTLTNDYNKDVMYESYQIAKMGV